MTKSTYNRTLIEARLISNRAQVATGKEIVRVLERAYKDLSSLMKLSSTGPATYANLSARRESISDLLSSVTRELNVTTRLSMRRSAEDVVDLYSGLNKKFGKDAGFTYNWASSFSTVPVQAVRNVIARVYADGQNFSRRIWNLTQYADKSINEMVSSAVARGQSVTDLARNIRGFLVDPVMSDSLSYTMSGLKSVTGRGTVHYNAYRLAKTEINNTYREALVVANDSNPIMDSVHWNLSNRHSVPDICDVWAQMDAFGKGPGNYPASRTPIDHPGGNCFLTENIRNPAEWSKPKEQAEYQAPSKSEVLSVFEGEDVSEGQKTAAWKMWNATNQLTQQRFRKAA